MIEIPSWAQSTTPSAYNARCGQKRTRKKCRSIHRKVLAEFLAGTGLTLVVSALVVGVILMLTGCSSPMPVTLHHANTGAPVEDALVQRERPVNAWEKFINPVGAFYHSRWHVESVLTDAQGQTALSRTGPDDVYEVTVDSRAPMIAMFGTNSVRLTPGEEIRDLYRYRVNPGESWRVWVGPASGCFEQTQKRLRGKRPCER